MASSKAKIPQDPLFDVGPKPRRPPTSQIRDSLVDARRFHGWTQDKLEVLRLYLGMFRRVAGSGTYIDTCAGDGRALIRGNEVLGSVPLAISADTFKSMHLFEKPEVMERLEFFLASKYTIKVRRKIRTYAGDVNVELPKVLASGVIPRDRTCFAFVDPNSTEIDWDTIAALADYKTFVPGTKLCKVEQWILVNTGHALQRMWPRDRTQLPPADVSKTLDRVMGGRAAWKDLFIGGQSSTHLAYRYAERLQSELGYQYAVPHKIRRTTSTSAIQYFMVHATDHPAAIDFMTWAEKTPTAKIAREAKLPM